MLNGTINTRDFTRNHLPPTARSRDLFLVQSLQTLRQQLIAQAHSMPFSRDPVICLKPEPIKFTHTVTIKPTSAYENT